MSHLRLVLADQLSDSLSALNDVQAGDTILLCEVMEEATYVRHHPKKIAFLFAAMRHFADGLKGKGFQVRYVTLQDPANTGSLTTEVARAAKELGLQQVIVTEPGEYRVRQMMLSWQAELGLSVEIRTDDRFLCAIDRFARWANGKKQLRMEYFYR
ncbi:MAG: cryptochrome/photolyase family protein, partial [Rhizobiales bacterium]|nr:cryptochrome/photolyase family protein [Hyphomicrobiales bacterium]